MGRLECNWPRPLDYDPQRFLGETQPSPFLHIAFNAGRRTCLGQTLALTEGAVVLALIARSYEVTLEGNFWPSIPGNGSNWYDVPFAIMVPKRGQGTNLLVPVALSASAVAYSSTRIENRFMSGGAAAGVAAKQLVDGSAATVQDVDVAVVQAILSGTFGQRIHGPPA
jgi:hypothetical protein